MWKYSQSTGTLDDANETFVARGYSGAGVGKNNPAMQNVPDVGPIPQGQYTINPPVDTVEHGPYVLQLVPNDYNEMFGRSGFLIHGDSLEHPGQASEGCIVMSRPVRELIWNSGDRFLAVVV